MALDRKILFVSFSNLSPTPLVKQSERPEGLTDILKCSPYKQLLEINSCPAIHATKRSVKRPATATTKGKGQRKKPKITQETSQADAPCLFWGEMFSQSRCDGEQWIQCLMRNKMGTPYCSGAENDSFCCDLCLQ